MRREARRGKSGEREKRRHKGMGMRGKAIIGDKLIT